MDVDHVLGPLDVAGGRPQRLDLLVRRVEVRSRILQEHRDVDLLEPVHEPARVVRGDDEVGLVACDRLDVRLEAGKIRQRRLGRDSSTGRRRRSPGRPRRWRRATRSRSPRARRCRPGSSSIVSGPLSPSTVTGNASAGGVSTTAEDVAAEAPPRRPIPAAPGEDERKQDSQKGCERSVEHVSSFREGNGSRASARSSDSGLPPPPPSRPSGQWRLAEERLPSQRRDRAGLAPASLDRSPSVAGAYSARRAGERLG